MDCENCNWPSPETCRVCKQEIVNIPIGKLVEVANDPTMLALIISTAFNQGIQTGHLRAHTNINEMYRDYNKVTLEN